MKILSKIEAAREANGLRFEDYSSYASHLSKRLHSLRKSLNLTSSAKSGKPKPISSSSDERVLELIIWNAERAWSTSMNMKSTGAKPQLTVNKLRKAKKYASQLLSLLPSTTPNYEILEAKIYEEFLAGTLNLEKSAYESSIPYFSRSLLALESLPPTHEYPSFKNQVEAGLRFCIYQTGSDQRVVDLHSFSIEHISDNTDNHLDDISAWKTLVLDVDSSALDAKKGDEMVSQINWAGRIAHLSNPAISSSISAALSLRQSLPTSSPSSCLPTAADKVSQKKLIAAEVAKYDPVLAAWSTALSQIQSLLEKEEDQVASQNLELTKAYITYYSTLDRIARDKLLAKTLPRTESVALWEGVGRAYAVLMSIPGVTPAEKEDLEQSRRMARAERCLVIADGYSGLEKIALINRATTYFNSDIERNTEGGSRKEEIQRLLNLEIAKYQLSSNGPRTAESSFSLDKWYSGSLKTLIPGSEMHRVGTGAISEAVPLKPIVFDVAFNYLSSEDRVPAPRLSPPSTQNQKQETLQKGMSDHGVAHVNKEVEVKEDGKKRGILGLFSR